MAKKDVWRNFPGRRVEEEGKLKNFALWICLSVSKSKTICFYVPRRSNSDGSAGSLFLFPSPIKSPTENALDYPVVGRRRCTYADAKVDLPLRRHVEVDDRKHLLLLIMKAEDISQAAVVRVIFDAPCNHLGECVADLRPRCENESILNTRPMPRALKCR